MLNKTSFGLFYAIICVKLRTPMQAADPGQARPYQSLVGYYAHYGLRAETKEKAASLLREVISDGDIDWSETVWKDPSALAPAILSKSAATEGTGIWYKSGKVFF
jgi:hypothetical protein